MWSETPEPEAIDVAIGRFAGLIERIAWFSSLGRPLDGARELAQGYLDGLGMPELAIAPLGDWQAAELVAANPEIDDLWWDTEEQLRLSITAQALEMMEAETLTSALETISGKAANVVFDAAREAAALDDVSDEALITAAAGSASKSCHQAALVILSGGGGDHPFALKFRLFEAGRWPVGVTGGSFNLF